MNSNLSNVWPVTVKKSWMALLFVGLFTLAGCGGGGSSEASLNCVSCPAAAIFSLTLLME